MTHGQKRRAFTRDIGHLIEYAFDVLGYELQINEAYRDPEWQHVMVRRGASRTLKSRHTEGLAVDFSLFINGEYKKDTPAYAELGRYWKSLNTKNVWGGDFGWDGNHFEREP